MRTLNPTRNHPPVPTPDAVGSWGWLSALARLRHPHIQRLIDLSDAGSGRPEAAFEALHGGDLPSLLHRRVTIAPGEAVTILAPLVDAVRAAHASGVAHRRITASAISFDRFGRPVLCRWEHAAVVTATGAAADWRALSGVAREVIASAAPGTEGRGCSVEDVLETAGPSIASHEAFGTSDVVSRLERWIFDLARPLPVLLADGMPEPDPLPVEPASSSERRRDLGSGTAAVMSRAVIWASALRGATRGLAARSGRSRRRRRRLIAYGLSLATVGTIGVLLAMSSGDRTATISAGASRVTAPTPTVSSESSAGSPSSGTPEPAASPVPSVIPVGEADAGADLDAALDADDPLAAGRILVDLREACLDGSDPECLGQVDEPGSAIEAADRLMLAGATPSGAPRAVVEASSLHLIGAQGDAAMLGADVVLESAPAGTTERQPVTILVMRTETGWRLREVFNA